VDPFPVKVGSSEEAAVGDALGDALVRPGRVLVHLVLGQDGAQMRLAENQHAVEDFRRRVPTRRSQIAFIRGA
jgi:hypothetical protein